MALLFLKKIADKILGRAPARENRERYFRFLEEHL